MSPQERARQNRQKRDASKPYTRSDREKIWEITDAFERLREKRTPDVVFEFLKKQSLISKALGRDGFKLSDYAVDDYRQRNNDTYVFHRRTEGWVIPRVFHWRSGTYETEGMHPLNISINGLVWNGALNIDAGTDSDRSVIGVPDFNPSYAYNLRAGYEGWTGSKLPLVIGEQNEPVIDTVLRVLKNISR